MPALHVLSQLHLRGSSSGEASNGLQQQNTECLLSFGQPVRLRVVSSFGIRNARCVAARMLAGVQFLRLQPQGEPPTPTGSPPLLQPPSATATPVDVVPVASHHADLQLTGGVRNPTPSSFRISAEELWDGLSACPVPAVSSHWSAPSRAAGRHTGLSHMRPSASSNDLRRLERQCNLTACASLASQSSCLQLDAGLAPSARRNGAGSRQHAGVPASQVAGNAPPSPMCAAECSNLQFTHGCCSPALGSAAALTPRARHGDDLQHEDAGKLVPVLGASLRPLGIAREAGRTNLASSTVSGTAGAAASKSSDPKPSALDRLATAGCLEQKLAHLEKQRSISLQKCEAFLQELESAMAASSQARFGKGSGNGDSGGTRHDRVAALAADAPSTAIARRHRGMQCPAMCHRSAGCSSPPSPPPLSRCELQQCEASSRMCHSRLRASRSVHHLPGLAAGQMPSSCSTGHLPLLSPTSRLHTSTGSSSRPRTKGSTTPRLRLRQQQQQQCSSSSPIPLTYDTLMMSSPPTVGHWLTSSREEPRPAVIQPVCTAPHAIQWEADMRYYALRAPSECNGGCSPPRNRRLSVHRGRHEGRVGESLLLRFQACEHESALLRSASRHSVKRPDSSNSSNNSPPSIASRSSRHYSRRGMLLGMRPGSGQPVCPP